MRIFKFLLAACVATACASLISARADQDNPAQAAARAALIEKMNELDNGQQNQTPTNTTAPAETNAPTTATPAAPPPIVVTASGATVEQPSQPTNAETATPAPAQPATAPAPEMTSTSVPAPVVVPVVTSPPTNPVVQPTEPAPAPAVAAPPVVETKPVASKPSVSEIQPIVAPPLPISTSKESQLQALLEKYKADQITPAEYQKQRTAILAQPD